MSAKAIAVMSLGIGLLGATLVVAQDRTPPAAANGSAASGGDAKTGTSPPVQAGGAGVKGKSDAGAGTTQAPEKQK